MRSSFVSSLSCGLLFVGGLCLPTRTVEAGGLFRQSTVGGISIDLDGLIAQPDLAMLPKVVEALRQSVKGGQGDLALDVTDRKISLRGLEAALGEALRNGFGAIPEEARYLAGIQRIKYILVYPEQRDIVLVGPGENWTVDEGGNVVGVNSGAPMIALDDFLVAMRSIKTAGQQNISCSIDPKPAGLEALNTLLAQSRTFDPTLVAQIEKSLGPQDVTIQGIPGDTHFARVLAACDYRMKRIAMKLDESPVRRLPSYLDLVNRVGGGGNPTPRWWLACNYEPLARSEDGLSWELRGPGVKAMTADEIVSADGQRTETGGAGKHAERWAALMTEHYEELSKREPVFAELRNLMDLCVVAALIDQHQLLERAGCELPLIMNPSSDVMTEGWNTPKTVASHCSFVKRGNNFIIAASGGIDIASRAVLASTTIESELNDKHQQTQVHTAALNGAKWWSN